MFHDRTQVDGLGEEYSLASAYDTTKTPDTARQEHKDDADVNILLARFGVDQPQKSVVFGEMDFSLDLQQAITACRESESAHERLHPDLKAKYPTWQTMITAMHDGTLAKDLEDNFESKRQAREVAELERKQKARDAYAAGLPWERRPPEHRHDRRAEAGAAGRDFGREFHDRRPNESPGEAAERRRRPDGRVQDRETGTHPKR